MAYILTTRTTHNSPTEVSLPTSFTELRHSGSQPINDLYRNAPNFYRDFRELDKKQWAYETFSKPDNLCLALACLSFVAHSLTNLALVANSFLFVKHFASILNPAQTQSQSKQAKYHCAGQALKILLYTVIPGGLLGMTVYLAGCLTVDKLSQRARSHDASNGTDLNLSTISAAYKTAGKEMHQDVSADLQTALHTTPGNTSF
jgi:hypothetical protein